MDNGEAARGHAIQPGSPERDEQYHGTTAFPWMGHYQATPVETFPTMNGPIVHEGFVPDDNDGIDLDRLAGYTRDWSVSSPASSTPAYRPRFLGNLDDYYTGRDSRRSQGEAPGFMGLEGRNEGSFDLSSDDDDDPSVSGDDSQ